MEQSPQNRSRDDDRRWHSTCQPSFSAGKVPFRGAHLCSCGDLRADEASAECGARACAAPCPAAAVMCCTSLELLLAAGADCTQGSLTSNLCGPRSPCNRHSRWRAAQGSDASLTCTDHLNAQAEGHLPRKMYLQQPSA